MIKRKLLYLVLASCCHATNLSAAGLYLYEIATPETGFAAAGRASNASDASTAFTNPAGMTQLSRHEITAGLQPVYLNTKFRPSGGTTVIGNDGGDAGGFIPGGAFYYAGQFSQNIWLGLSLNSYLGAVLDFDDTWVGRYFADELNLITFNVNPSIGIKINDFISIGGGGSLQYGYFKNTLFVNNLLDSLPDGKLKLKDDSFAGGYNLGILVKFMPELTAGITYRSGVKHKFKDVATLTGGGPLLRAIYNARGLDNKTIDLQTEIPQEVMASFTILASDVLTLMGNFGWQDWKSFGKSEVVINSLTPTSLTFERMLKNTYHYAIGAKYKYNLNNTLTLGFAFDSNPVEDHYRTLDLPIDRQIRYAIGWQHQYCPTIKLGIAYSYVDLGKADINQRRGILSGTVVGDYHPNAMHVVNFSLIWKSKADNI